MGLSFPRNRLSKNVKNAPKLIIPSKDGIQ